MSHQPSLVLPYVCGFRGSRGGSLESRHTWSKWLARQPAPTGVDCVNLGDTAKNCALDCLKPWNWGKGPQRNLKKQKPDCSGKGGTYTLRNRSTGEVERTGRTKDFDQRRRDHRRQFPDLEFRRDRATDDAATRRGLEQLLHEQQRAPLDRINPISDRIKRFDEHIISALEYLTRCK